MENSSVPINAIFEEIKEGLYMVDHERRILYWNRAAERITGFQRNQAVGQFCFSNMLQHVNEKGEQLCHNGCPLSAALEDGLMHMEQVFLHHAEGHRVPVTVRVLPVIQDGKTIGAVEIFSLETTLDSAFARVAELENEIIRDPLTGIANRRAGQFHLGLAAREFELNEIPYAVLMIDVDFFKQVNDQYGHDNGDLVLKMVAASLSSGVRAVDFICRWGGEEFVGILRGVDAQSLPGAAERLRMMVDKSFLYLADDQAQEKSIHVTVSIGAALAQRGEPPEAVLARADRGLYQSKADGRNRVTLIAVE